MTAGLFELPAKAPYTVPTMGEIRARDNGLTAVSTFSGGGGSSTGLHMAGWRVPYASEFINPARETYEVNWPETYVDPRDIRLVQPGDILDRIGLKPGELDLFEGSPPCSSFSTMNSHGKTSQYGNMKVKDYSDGVKQTTDDLFGEWLRLLAGLMPRAVLAENVPDLLGPNSLHLYREILREIEGLGYRATAAVYKATHYGSVTVRKRLIIRAVRRDVAPTVGPEPRKVSERHSIGEALDTLPVLPSADELAHSDASGYSTGKFWHSIQPGQRWEAFTQIMRCSYTMQLPGITAGGAGRGGAGPMHPDECRQFTPTELAWMFGYPPDYQWPGTPAQRYERIARSVAPPLYRAHGAALAATLGGTPT